MGCGSIRRGAKFAENGAFPEKVNKPKKAGITIEDKVRTAVREIGDIPNLADC